MFKKSAFALAVLGAFSAPSMAQSSVTLYGTVDLNGRYVKNDNTARRFSMAQDGVNSSQLGFRGLEDLGGGLRAGFNLLAGVNADTGTANAKFFNRRATVSLFSPLGELRLGRDYVPTFWNLVNGDAFGYLGLGSGSNIIRYTHPRQDNSIGYFLPSNLGGLYGQAMVAASENGTSADRPGRYVGGRIGFAAGPFDVAVAAAQQRFAASSAVTGAPATTIVAGDKVSTINAMGSFDFGFIRLMGNVENIRLERSDEKRAGISANFRFGQGEFRVGYTRSKYDSDAASAGADSTLQHVGATYQYNLSKRTAMYGTAAWLDNKDGTAIGLPGGNAGMSAGGSSKGFELGVRHFF